jgi:membrane glycosyltransferase
MPAPLARAVALGVATALSALVLALVVGGVGSGSLGLVLGLLVAVNAFWLAFGAATGLLGLSRRLAPPPEAPFEGTAVLLLPICNEDPGPIFARIAAMDAELHLAGLAPRVDVAILSDTRDAAVAAEEAGLFARLMREAAGEGRMFYRRRESNRGRKAGNIEDFIRRSGGAYEVAVILDADSLMSADTIGRMLRRMAADPSLALLQTVPAILRARSRFGRMTAFGGALYGPAFARGLARLQGRTGPFWGHNAAIRVRAFAGSCGLPELSGSPPFGGHVLSHDHVEAALLARAGWTVRLDPDLGGSWEEGPDNILSFARRDRRWCQGNLQHARILLAPGLRGWSRFALLQGVAAYVVPPLWLLVVVLGLTAEPVSEDALLLALLVFALLFAPKVLMVWSERARAPAFGGTLHLLASVGAEAVQSALVAPVLLMFQARSVLQVCLGRDGGWPPQARGDGPVGLAQGWRAAWWIALWGAALLAAGLLAAPALLPWLLPMALPMALAPWVIAWTSRPPLSLLFMTPADLDAPTSLRRAEGVLARWTRMGTAPAVSVLDPVPSLEPVALAQPA